jgi:hypothetical protein
MTKRLLLSLALSLIIITGGFYLLGIAAGFITRPASVDVPVTYKVGWWPSQEALLVTDLKVDVVKSDLNMFNSHSLLSYQIQGTLSLPRGGWEPYVKEIHISERYVQPPIFENDSAPKSVVATKKHWKNYSPQAILEITPVIATRYRKTYKANESITFGFTNEHRIKSFWWGDNFLAIQCMGFEEMITIRQRK